MPRLDFSKKKSLQAQKKLLVETKNVNFLSISPSKNHKDYLKRSAEGQKLIGTTAQIRQIQFDAKIGKEIGHDNSIDDSLVHNGTEP